MTMPRLAAWIGRHPVLALWSAWAALLVLLAASDIRSFGTQDPDDYMRLLQVRDLLDGQAWFDVRQYRMDPPDGAAMHWSRLVDVPLALVLALFRLALAEPAASTATMVVVPLATLLVVMALVERLMAALGANHRARLIAVAIVPLFPVLSTTYAPMRIDHHGWQGVAALACGVLLVRAPDRRAAALAGAVAATWLTISLEGLPLVVLLGAIYGARCWWWRDRSLSWFLAGLALASPLLFVATRPLSQFAVAVCDAVSWPHLAGFAAAAATMAVSEVLPHRRTGLGRAVAPTLAASIAAATAILPLGRCAIDPFATLDPLMRTYWHQLIYEGLPITRQFPSVQAMLAWTPLIVGAGWLTVRSDPTATAAERQWAMLALYALAATLVSLLVMRAAINAQLLAVPFAAVLIERWLPRARRIRPALLRALATVGLFAAATPALASGLLKNLDDAFRPPAAARMQAYETRERHCDLRKLRAIPPAHLFAALHMGPEILARARHTVVTSGYHRNLGKMREVIEAFSGDPRNAERLVRGNHAGYVALCLASGEAAAFRSRRRDNLVSRLAGGEPPPWLEPVAGLDRGVLLLYRVRPPAQAGMNTMASPFMQ